MEFHPSRQWHSTPQRDRLEDSLTAGKDDALNSWDMRYSNKNYLFGKDPSHFLTERIEYFQPGQVALMVADGEGRNGVYLANQGLRIHSVDGSTIALRKAKKLADEVGVQLVLEQADVTDWTWYEDSYDHVIGIMIQFADPDTRTKLFEDMKRAVKPGGLLMLHGYRPEQVELGTGGPSDPAHMYTGNLLREAFADFEIVELTEEDRRVEDGVAHRGQSALINLVARKPLA